LQSLLDPILHMRAHGLVGGQRIDTRNCLHQLTVKAERKRSPLHGDIEEPVMHEDIVHLDGLLKRWAARILGNPHVQFEVMGMHHELQLQIVVILKAKI